MRLEFSPPFLCRAAYFGVGLVLLPGGRGDFFLAQRHHLLDKSCTPCAVSAQEGGGLSSGLCKDTPKAKASPYFVEMTRLESVPIQIHLTLLY